MPLHLTFILFLFVLGACIGSFLNVVVWRMPRGQSLVSPPSHCPRCSHRLAWYDNIPVFGWILLRGRCRYCAQPISARYPVVEALTGLLFVFYYVMFFVLHIGPCAPRPELVGPDLLGQFHAIDRMPTTILVDWPIYGLYMLLIAALVAVTLIDAELYVIPPAIPYLVALVAFIVHAAADTPVRPGALNLVAAGGPSPGAALAAGGAVGLAISMLLAWRKVLPASFPQGEPMLEVDLEAMRQEAKQARREGRPVDFDEKDLPPVYTKAQIRAEMRKEIAFLLPPLAGAFAWLCLTHYVPAVGRWWMTLASPHWVSGLLGSVLGAMVGGLVVWLARIFGTLWLGRVAMGLGDVDLMFGVGAAVGAGAATVAFFLAPFAGLAIGIWRWLSRSRHEMPFGPYLSVATAAVMLCYCPIANYLAPGFAGLVLTLESVLQSAGL